MGSPVYEVLISAMAPLGYRKQTGLSLIRAAVVTIRESSISSEGAITIMFGKHDIKVMSNDPECAAPSGPTNPALGITNLTGIFCRSTSLTTYQKKENASGNSFLENVLTYADHSYLWIFNRHAKGKVP